MKLAYLRRLFICVTFAISISAISTLVTTDPARLSGLRNMHVRFIRERDDTPMASFIDLVLAAEDVQRKGDWITAGNEIRCFWRLGCVDLFIRVTGSMEENGSFEDIPDPKPRFGIDPVRYASTACISEQTAEVYNWRLDKLNVRIDGQGRFRVNGTPDYRILGARVLRAVAQMSDHPQTLRCR
ncbi:hypothetical protein EDD85DRAFT_790422 [Armillaria nabsnona]|nr:hypothetical protein EDD85DRAFT_790422 [Armillaria nabsnona]